MAAVVGHRGRCRRFARDSRLATAAEVAEMLSPSRMTSSAIAAIPPQPEFTYTATVEADVAARLPGTQLRRSSPATTSPQRDLRRALTGFHDVARCARRSAGAANPRSICRSFTARRSPRSSRIARSRRASRRCMRIGDHRRALHMPEHRYRRPRAPRSDLDLLREVMNYPDIKDADVRAARRDVGASISCRT